MRMRLAAGSGPVVQAAALRAWSLLLTTAPPGLLDSEFIESSLGRLAKCLHSSSVDVRAAGGEAAALLYHSSGLAALDAESAAGEPSFTWGGGGGGGGGGRGGGGSIVLPHQRSGCS